MVAEKTESSTAMGATFDRELVEEVGLKLLAREAKLRSASVVLAPTCNIQRVSAFIVSPLIRRNFYFVYRILLGEG